MLSKRAAKAARQTQGMEAEWPRLWALFTTARSVGCVSLPEAVHGQVAPPHVNVMADPAQLASAFDGHENADVFAHRRQSHCKVR